MKTATTSFNRILGLQELPASSRTLTIGDKFLISDNLESGSINEYNLRSPSVAMLNTPLKLSYTAMILCTRGKMRLRYRMLEYTMTEGNLLLITEGSVVECLEISEDATFIMMCFSKDFDVIESGVAPSAELLSVVLRRPMVRLTTEESSGFMTIYNMLRSRMGDSGYGYSRELAVSCIRTLLCYVLHYFTSPGKEIVRAQTRKECHLERFLQLVDEFSCRERKLSFYADRLCISEKYMSRIVSELTGRTPRNWICMRVIMEAKMLLKEGELSVAQISERLNFSTQTFFGTFFKSYVGISPCRYRNK